jgi:hypothetical protein
MTLKIIDEDDEKEYLISKIETENSPDFKEFYVTETFGGGFGPYDMRLSFYDSRIEKKQDHKKVEFIEKRIVKDMVIMSFASAKQLHTWLGKQLELYEKASGHPIYAGMAAASVDGDV